MPADKNQASGRDKKYGVYRCPENCCSKCGASLDVNEPPAHEDTFPEDDFICPACCCGIYIEVREE